MKIPILTTTMRITEVNPEAIDLIEANILDDFSDIKILMVEANVPKTHTKVNIKVTIIKAITTKAIMVYTTTHIEAINRVKIMANLEAEAMVWDRGGCGHGRSNYRGNNNYQYHWYYGHDDGYQPDQYGPPFALCGGYNCKVLLLAFRWSFFCLLSLVPFISFAIVPEVSITLVMH